MSELVRDAAEDVGGEDGDVLDALAQRRQAEHDRADAEVEILAEASGCARGVHVVMRGRDEAHVGEAVFDVAQAAEAFVLEHLEQLRLHLQVDVADLVEKQRPAVGEVEAAPASPAPRR